MSHLLIEALIEFIFELFLLNFIWKNKARKIWFVVLFFTFPILMGILISAWKPKRISSERGKSLLLEIKNYNKVYKSFPPDLDVIVGNNPLKRDWITDGWGTDFHYRKTTDSFLLYSSGKDRIQGTKDDL